jgi:hypothetical protein
VNRLGDLFGPNRLADATFLTLGENEATAPEGAVAVRG